VASQLTSQFQDGGHNVISRRKVLPPDEWRQSVCRCPCSSVRQFLTVCSYLFALVHSVLCTPMQ